MPSATVSGPPLAPDRDAVQMADLLEEVRQLRAAVAIYQHVIAELLHHQAKK